MAGSAIVVIPKPTARETLDFQAAVESYRLGNYAEAWGRFYRLANAGDPDAARIALHMLRYGPILHGTHWDAGQDEVDFWVILDRSNKGRPTPAFRPRKYQQGVENDRPIPQRLVQSAKPRPFNEVPAPLPTVR